MLTTQENFRELLAKHQGYSEEAYIFTYTALNYATRRLKRHQDHVTAREFLEGWRLHAIDQFGCLAKTVLNNWGVYTTSDIGNIIFNLIEHDLMGRQEEDKREQFDHVYDFDKVFNLKPVFSYFHERNEWSCTYIQK